MAARRLGEFALSIWRLQGPGSIPWHTHERSYVTFVVRGEYREHLGGATRSCATRAIVTHAPGETHRDDFAAPATCLSIESDRRFQYDDISLVMQSANAAAIGDRIVHELQRHDPFSPLVVEGLMLEMFGEAARERVATFEPAWLRDVRNAVAIKPDAKVTLADLARKANVHPTHLARAFRRHYGRTIGEAIRESRIENAKRQIVAGVSLCEVAIACGFTDQSHFSRTFRRITGLTPAAFRRVNTRPRR